MEIETYDPVLIRHFKGHKGKITQLSFNNSGDQVVSSSLDYSLMLWNFDRTSRCIKFSAHTDSVNSVAWSPTSEVFASASSDRTVRLWVPKIRDAASGVLVHQAVVRSVDFSPNGQNILSASDDKSVKLWKVTHKKFITSFVGHTNWIRSAKFNPTGEYFASCGDDKMLRIYDISLGKCINIYCDEKGAGLQLAWHPDSYIVAVGLSNNRIKIYDRRINELVQLYHVHCEPVNSVSFHPSGKYLLSASNDGTMKIMDLIEGRPIYTLTGHLSPVTAAEFSKDGEYFASGGEDKELMIWKSNFCHSYGLRDSTNSVENRNDSCPSHNNTLDDDNKDKYEKESVIIDARKNQEYEKYSPKEYTINSRLRLENIHYSEEEGNNFNSKISDKEFWKFRQENFEYEVLNKITDLSYEMIRVTQILVAPQPTEKQNFEYHWKQIKLFFNSDKQFQKIHIDDTNVPYHLERMLQVLFKENDTAEECIKYLLENNSLEIFTDICIADNPPGIRLRIINWLRRLLSCVKNPPLQHPSFYQHIKEIIKLCDGKTPSAYEEEEVVFLETVAGLICKDSWLFHLFLPSHHYYVKRNSFNERSTKNPKNNALFESSTVETRIRRVEIVPNLAKAFEDDAKEVPKLDTKKINSKQEDEIISNISCDCDVDEKFNLLNAILTYFDSPNTKNTVRALEGALIICSSPSLDTNCSAISNSVENFISFLVNKLIKLIKQIPNEIDPGDVEEFNVSWGLMPRETDVNDFIGRNQLHQFICWLDYINCVARECSKLVNLFQKFRNDFLLETIETALIVTNTISTLVLMSKVIKQISSTLLMEEIANWLVGDATQEEYSNDDCLLNIIIDNARENSEILLAVLQFVEALIDNPNEKILNEMLFRYVNNRGYYDASSCSIQTWSDEEDERDRRRGDTDVHKKSKTFAPHNILKVINNFLLLIPRQIMVESIGTCYEEYVQDASRHYKIWTEKTEHFSWPIEAITNGIDNLNISARSTSSSIGTSHDAFIPIREHKNSQCCDSGISEESFYEGPLLRLLFEHVRNMSKHPCELNLAVIAILSKLAFLPHPYLHEILLNPEIPIVRGAKTLWISMQSLANILLIEIPKQEHFQQKIGDAAKRLLSNPPILCENIDDIEPLFEAIVVLEEFCKELAAIAFVKFHYATK